MFQLTSMRNSGGFTLVEVMVAVLIMMVGLLGLLETINVSLQHNLRNNLRDEAVTVGERYMTSLRGKAFTNLSATPYPVVDAPSKIRGGSKNYRIERTWQDIASDDSGPTSRRLVVVVKWAFRNATSVNTVVSVVTRP